MRHDRATTRGGSDLAALIITPLCCTAAVIGLLFVWGNDPCDGAKVSAALLTPGPIGCADFWLERYQTLVTGLIAAVIAIVSAYLVLASLRRMDRSNHVAERALILSEKQRIDEERRRVSEALELVGRFHGHWNVLPLAIGDSLKQVAGGASVRKEFSDRMEVINPVLQEFRRSVPPVLSTKEERQHYRDFADRTNAAFLYFFKGAAIDYGMDVAGLDEGSRYTANTVQDAVRLMISAGQALTGLQRCLSDRLDSLD